jgi:hypothetical protein
MFCSIIIIYSGYHQYTGYQINGTLAVKVDEDNSNELLIIIIILIIPDRLW